MLESERWLPLTFDLCGLDTSILYLWPLWVVHWHTLPTYISLLLHKPFYLGINKTILSKLEWISIYHQSGLQKIFPLKQITLFFELKLCLCLYITVSNYLQSHDYSPPVSLAHGIFQGRILEWLVISFSREFSQPRDWNCVSCVSCNVMLVPLLLCHLGSLKEDRESWIVLNNIDGGKLELLWQTTKIS